MQIKYTDSFNSLLSYLISSIQLFSVPQDTPCLTSPNAQIEVVSAGKPLPGLEGIALHYLGVGGKNIALSAKTSPHSLKRN